MRTTRILFDESETPESIARRIVRAFDPGEIFFVRGKFFKVSVMRTANETIRDNVIGDKYTHVLNVGEPEPPPPVVVVPEPPKSEPIVEEILTIPDPLPSEPPQPLSEPPPSAVVQSQPSKRASSESGEYKIVREGAAKVTKEGPPKTLPVPGQVWQTKDQRRANSRPFTVIGVGVEFVYTDKGGKISLKRWRNYRLVEASEALGVSQQSSG
jgi:hypothetical protein